MISSTVRDAFHPAPRGAPDVSSNHHRQEILHGPELHDPAGLTSLLVPVTDAVVRYWKFVARASNAVASVTIQVEADAVDRRL